MERTPVKNEFARTSTPRYSIYDSGFCGSEIRAFPSNPFYSLSPLKESPFKDELPFSRNSFLTFTPLKLQYSSPYDSSQNIIPIGKSNVIKQLSFEDSGISNESYNQQVKHTKFCQKNNNERGTNGTPYPIRRKRTPRVNILSWLKQINCERIISDLLSYLPAEDLCSVSCVNKSWRELVLEDVKANGRRREYLKSLRSHRENRSRSGVSPLETRRRYERLSFLSKSVFNDITNCVQEAKVPAKCSNSKFDSFIKEANNVGGPLMKCPSCKYAARQDGDDEFVCTNCDYAFCKKCLSPYSKNHKCPMLEVPTLVIGSKQCKRNLRRL